MSLVELWKMTLSLLPGQGGHQGPAAVRAKRTHDLLMFVPAEMFCLCLGLPAELKLQFAVAVCHVSCVLLMGVRSMHHHYHQLHGKYLRFPCKSSTAAAYCMKP